MKYIATIILTAWKQIWCKHDHKDILYINSRKGYFRFFCGKCKMEITEDL